MDGLLINGWMDNCWIDEDGWIVGGLDDRFWEKIDALTGTISF